MKLISESLENVKFCRNKIIVSKIILVINPLMIASVMIPRTGNGIFVI